MLILSRKKEESIIIDGNIEIKIVSLEDGKVKIGIEAPREVQIFRKEVFDQIQEENKLAATSKLSTDKLSDLLNNNKKDK